MLTLIKREIEDNIVFYIVVIILAVIFCSIIFWYQFYGERSDSGLIMGSISIVFVFSFFEILGLSAMGAAQMYWDKTKKISALLATLAVRRGHIFTAKIIAGTFLTIIAFIPQAVAIIAIVFNARGGRINVHVGFYAEILIPMMLFAFACYCTGLQAGWTSNKVAPTLGAIIPAMILVTVILVKSIGWEIYAILILFITACLIKAWRTFSSAAF